MSKFVRWIIIGVLALMTAFLVLFGPSARPEFAGASVFNTLPSTTQIAPASITQSMTAQIPNTGGSLTPAAPGAGPTIPPANGAANAPLPITASTLVHLRDQMCVHKLPYTILALPSSATAQIVYTGESPQINPVTHNPNQLVCTKVLVFGDSQTVVCTGPEASFFTLRVSNNGVTEDVSIPLQACVSSQSEEEQSQSPIVVPTSTPGTEPTQTEPVPTQPTEPPLPTEPVLPTPTP